MLCSLPFGTSQVVLVVKNPPAHAIEPGSIPGLGRLPGGGNGNLFQYSCLENPIDRRAWSLQRVGHLGNDLAHIEFVTILFLFYVLVFLLQGMWDLSSLTSD